MALRPHVQLRPHGLARGGPARADAPVVREGGDQEHAPAGLGKRVGRRGTGRWPSPGAGVGHLDAEGALGQCESDVEVTAGDVTVADGVGGEFRRDEGECLVERGRVGMAPVVQAVRYESAGEAGTAQPEYEVGTGMLCVFGRQLKLFRERADLDRARFGSLTGYSASTIASFEQARRIPPPRFIDQADEVLGAGGVLSASKEEVARAQYPAFFRDAARLEAEAVELHVYANQAVPGLLQTEEYARATFLMMRPPMHEELIEQRVGARMVRQEILSSRDAPLAGFVMDEAVLRRSIAGLDILRGQLEQVLLMGQRRNVEIQVMPLDREENAGMAGPFTLIETREGRRIAYAEVQNVSRLQTERDRVRALEAKYGDHQGAGPDSS
ncbi:hypothetical protein GCM10010510_40540 [Streptomyces anandii JCM 4720]|nr:hypothetical protein GCM10010510_40540 [Streptomyces anandii JCM 4720]